MAIWVASGETATRAVGIRSLEMTILDTVPVDRAKLPIAIRPNSVLCVSNLTKQKFPQRAANEVATYRSRRSIIGSCSRR